MPRFIRAFMRMLIRGPDREFIAGDLEEEYARRRDAGQSDATSWYIASAFRSAVNSWRAAPDDRHFATHRRSSTMETLMMDVRQGLRALSRRPAMTIVIVATLALATGATTGMFSIVNGVLMKPLSMVDQDRLITVWLASTGAPTDQRSVANPDFEDWRAQSKTFESLASYRSSNATLTGFGDATVIPAGMVSEGFFDVMKAPLLMGRAISAEEARPNGPSTVVISEEFWRTRLGGDRNVLGRMLQLGSKPYEIVGVARSGLDFPDGAQLWVPEQIDESKCGRGCVTLQVIGRLAPNATLDQARADLSAISAGIASKYPETNLDVIPNLVPVTELITGSVRRPLLVLLGAVLLVLLIACANVANILFANAGGRRGEFAVRKALGAGTARVARQLLVETVLLAAAGCAIGLALASWSIHLLASTIGVAVPRMADVQMDARVLGFSVALMVLCTIVFGLAPSLTLASTNLLDSMRGVRGSTTGRAASRRRALLIVGQVSLSLILLIGTGLLLRSFTALASEKPGFDATNVEKFSINLPSARYEDFDARIRFYETLRAQLAALPGVERVAAIAGVPLGGGGFGSSFSIVGNPPPEPGKEPGSSVRIVSRDYFETLRIPTVAGRTINANDRRDAQRVIVLSKKTAEWLFPGENPIGRQITLDASNGLPEGVPRTIVGIVGDVRSRELKTVSEREMYIPHAQSAGPSLTLIMRMKPGASPPMTDARKILQALDPNVPMRSAEPLSNNIDRQLARPRLYSGLLAGFAALAIILSAVGLYGLVAFQLSQRRREIGIRLAIGATSSQMQNYLFSSGMKPAIAGVVVGLAIAAVATRVITSLLYGVQATDAVTWIAVPLFFVALSAVVALIPARRARKIQPATVLGVE